MVNNNYWLVVVRDIPSGNLLQFAMGNGPFIDGLPNLNMVSFHGYVKSPEGNIINFWSIIFSDKPSCMGKYHGHRWILWTFSWTLGKLLGYNWYNRRPNWRFVWITLCWFCWFLKLVQGNDIWLSIPPDVWEFHRFWPIIFANTMESVSRDILNPSI